MNYDRISDELKHILIHKTGDKNTIYDCISRKLNRELLSMKFYTRSSINMTFNESLTSSKQNSKVQKILFRRRQRILDRKYHEIIRKIETSILNDPLRTNIWISVPSHAWGEYFCNRLNEDGVKTKILIDGILIPDYYLVIDFPF